MTGAAFRMTMALILAGAALHSSLDWPRYAAITRQYRIGPGWAANAASVLLPPLQVVAAALLLARPQAGCALALLLMAVFTAAIALNLARGRTAIECGCGGAEGQRISWTLVARNLVLGLLLCVAAAAPANRPQDVAALVGAAGFAGFLVATYFAASQMLANAQAFAARVRG